MQQTSSILNNSIAKEQHAFPKSARFPKAHCYTSNCSRTTYDKMSDFDETVKKGQGKPQHSFGSRLDRFHYTPTTAKNGTVGPANYPIVDTFSPVAYQERSSRFTFGVSRMNMKKSFIEQSQHLSSMGPSPDSYKDGPKFGELGQKPSMVPRRHRYGKRSDDYSGFYRTQQKHLPGPGFYNSFEVTGGVIPDAKIKTERQMTF